MSDVLLGMKWKGFKNSIPADEIETSKAADLSLNALLDSTEGKMVRRRGIDYGKGGDALIETLYVVGPPATQFKGLQVDEHRGPALGAGLPSTWRALFADEENVLGAYGQVAWNDSSTMRVIAYNGAWTGVGVPPADVVVWPYMLDKRGHTATERRKTAAGSRNSLEIADRVYYPNFGSEADDDVGAPMVWNKQFPFSAQAGFRAERCAPTGLCPPSWVPYFTLPAAVGAPTSEPWRGNDLFYYSVLFIYEDGSWGPAVQVRAPNPNLTTGASYINQNGVVDVGGYGLARLDTDAAAPINGYPFITWNDIPRGGAGVTGRVLLRSPKVDALVSAVPDPKDLRVVAIINNNVDTTYVDAGGLDVGLLVDLRIRSDHIWQPPARYLGQFDQRICASYIRDLPWGILVTFRHNTAALTNPSLHNNQDTSFEATRQAFVTVDATNIYLDVALADPALDTHRRFYALAATTLQQLVDKINSQRQVSGADSNTAYRWHAQLVPGADGSALATTLVATGEWGDRSYTTPVGAALVDAAFTTLFLTAINGIRSLASGWPAVTRSNAHTTIFRNTLAFTPGGPGVVANAARSYTAFNQRSLPPDAGDCAGPVLPMIDGGLVPATRAICAIRNIRDGKTGVDEDYRVEVFDNERACISSANGLGPGFVVLLTSQGIYAYDRETWRGICISQDLYNPDTLTGELAYEIAQCIAATGKDDSTGYFSMKLAENQIWISYRSSSAVTRPDRQLVMDFSPGIEQRGLATLIDPETGQPWGWSPPHRPLDTIPTADTPGQNPISFSAMGVVRYSDGLLRWFGTRDRHNTAVNEGRVDEFNVGVQDGVGGTPVNVSTMAVYSKIVRHSDVRSRHQANRITTKYKKNGAGITAELTRNPKDAAPTFTTKALPTSGTKTYDRFIWNLLLSFRTPAEATQVRWVDDGTTSNRPEIWGAIKEVELIDTGA